MKDDSNPTSRKQDRRDFLGISLGLSAAGMAALAAAETAMAQGIATSPNKLQSLIVPGDTVLFQGDSITDAGRSRETDVASKPNHQSAMGNGYAWLAASQLLIDRPNDNLKFFSRGISGNKVYQLAERWQADCLDLKPNVVSILIGVNDIAHALNHDYDGTLETYEDDYRDLLNRTKDALPNVRLVICEPFVTRCGAVDDSWFPAFDGYRVAARRMADEVLATFVPFQSMFDAAAKIAPPEHWAADGVHPTPAGAALMAHAWLKAIGA
ncbi:MAG: SGNH/GDSL hydrolase family protein [Planctomycetes bacterium]|nr:SGNH/GDSL hydrolase family protein [Planctomycetota bacterium]